jgi:hypothetical protein
MGHLLASIGAYGLYGQDLLQFADVVSSYLYVSIYGISYYSFGLVLKLFILGTSTFSGRDECGGVNY